MALETQSSVRPLTGTMLDIRMNRLNGTDLDGLPAGVTGPEYDRQQDAGIVHLGIGAFHRAHQAVYFDALLNQGAKGWMIRGASLRSKTVADALNPQQGLYTVRASDDRQDRLQVIGAIKDVAVGPSDPAALIARLAGPETKLVTLTITEKGYCVNTANRTLNEESPAIKHDVQNINQPISAPGFLVAGLAARRAAGLAPFTVLSCDNLPENGEVARKAVLSLANLISPELTRWIEDEGAFPSSMVDRIVPAVAANDIDDLAALTGYRDEAMVKTEPFSQWVIEDHFCNDRPDLERVGVYFTSDVRQWEMTKLRMLNGAHSALAYLGGLAGHDYVSDAVSEPDVAAFMHQLWDEIEVTLPAIEDFSVADYRRSLFERFCNSKLQHRTHQIAMDGSQKMPQRILAPLRDRVAKGLQSPALTIALASWIKWQRGVDDRGNKFQIIDPLVSRLQALVQEAGCNSNLLVKTVLSSQDIFGDVLKDNAKTVENICQALKDLDQFGAFGRKGVNR